MHNLRVFILSLPLMIGCLATAQPQFGISKIVGRNSISDIDAQRIHQYAMGWASALQTTDTYSLLNAHQHLVEPLDPLNAMSLYARSLYGRALKEGFQPILSSDNENEIAAVNAIQVLSLIGTEQSCGILQRYADASQENRVSIRLSASIGIGKGFTLGVLPANRLVSVATVVADFASREPSWYVIARQFDSLTALQHVPGVNNQQRLDFEQLSLQLQARALVELIQTMKNNSGADERVQSLPLVLSSLRIQLIEPSINATTRSDTEETLLHALIDFIAHSNSLTLTKEEKGDVFRAYGDAIDMAGLLVNRILDSGDVDAENLKDLWNSGDHLAIASRVGVWKDLCKKR